MSQALYRKYRSRTLAEVVGQQHITDVLVKALEQQRIGHAFLFTGPKGTGKTSVARILAHAVNQLPYENDTTHLDIIEIDAASNRRIDDIRDLREKVHVAPTSASFKVYIIDEVHMLTGESFNALLKTLEEPPAHVIFILATTEVHKLPATIISRTQRFHFRLIPEPEVIGHLQHIAKQEGIAISDDALKLVAQHGEGSFRDSISLLDQLGALAGKDEITAGMVEAILGLAPKEQVRRLLEAITQHKPNETIALLSELEQAGISASVLVGQLLQELRRDPGVALQAYAVIEALIEIPRSHNPQMKLLAVLVRLATQQPSVQQKTAALATAPAPTISAPVKQLRQQPVAKVTAPKESAADETPPEAEAPLTPVATTPIEQLSWEEIMASIGAKHAPLHSVLRHARAQYEGTVLTLFFNYALHKKKIDDSKYRTLLAASISELYGACPEIATLVGSPPPQDAAAASVVAIMGGGEEVNAEK